MCYNVNSEDYKSTVSWLNFRCSTVLHFTSSIFKDPFSSTFQLITNFADISRNSNIPIIYMFYLLHVNTRSSVLKAHLLPLHCHLAPLQPEPTAEASTQLGRRSGHGSQIRGRQEAARCCSHSEQICSRRRTKS